MYEDETKPLNENIYLHGNNNFIKKNQIKYNNYDEFLNIPNPNYIEELGITLVRI